MTVLNDIFYTALALAAVGRRTFKKTLRWATIISEKPIDVSAQARN